MCWSMLWSWRTTCLRDLSPRGQVVRTLLGIFTDLWKRTEFNSLMCVRLICSKLTGGMGPYAPKAGGRRLCPGPGHFHLSLKAL